MILLTKNEAANKYIFELLGYQGGTCHQLPKQVKSKGRTHITLYFGLAEVLIYIGSSRKYVKDSVTVIRGDNSHNFIGCATVDFRAWDKEIKSDLRNFFLQYLEVAV